MSLKASYRHYDPGAPVPCENRPFRCEHWELCASQELACPSFRAWATRTRFPVMHRTQEEIWTPTREDFTRVFTENPAEEDLEIYLEQLHASTRNARRSAELAARGNPPMWLPGPDDPNRLVRDRPADRGAAEQLAAPAGVDPGLGAGHRQNAADAGRSLVGRGDLR